MEIGRVQTWYGDSNTIRGYTGRSDEDQPATISNDALGQIIITGAHFADERLAGNGIDGPANISIGSDTPGGMGDPLQPGRGTGVSLNGRVHRIDGTATNNDTVAANQYPGAVYLTGMALKPSGVAGNYDDDGWATINIVGRSAADTLAGSWDMTRVEITTSTNNNTGKIILKSENQVEISAGSFTTSQFPKLTMNASGTTLSSTALSIDSPVPSTALANLKGNVADQLMWGSRALDMMTGGGILTVDTSFNIKWSQRFIVISVGRGNNFFTNGNLSINMPAVGVTIPGYGGAPASTTVTASGIAMPAWSALYYEPTFGTDGTASDDYAYRMVGYTTNFTVPAHWIPIAVRNNDLGLVHFCNGAAFTPWYTPTLTGGWSNYGSGYDTFAYRKDGAGLVYTRGLIKSGASGFANPVFTLPVGFRPNANLLVPTSASGGIADVRIFTGGEFTVYGYFAGGTNGSVSTTLPPFYAAS
jgi:hypothetical protein